MVTNRSPAASPELFHRPANWPATDAADADWFGGADGLVSAVQRSGRDMSSVATTDMVRSFMLEKQASVPASVLEAIEVCLGPNKHRLTRDGGRGHESVVEFVFREHRELPVGLDHRTVSRLAEEVEPS